MDYPGGSPEVPFVHRDWHPARVRIVPREEAERAKAEMLIMFPHEPVQTLPIGCPHVCLYTQSASASVVEERIIDHLRDVEHRGLH